MMKISNIPDEVWLRAIDLEGLERPDPEHATPKQHYHNMTTGRGWTNGGFEQAIHEYMTLSGEFNEEDGEFAGINGYKAA